MNSDRYYQILISECLSALTGVGRTRLSGESITVSTTAIPLTTIPATATEAVIQVQAQSVTYRVLDGEVPTAAIGFITPAGTTITLRTRDELENFRVIRTGGADATIYVEYLKIA